MDHQQYIEGYLGLAADDELNEEERRTISAHVEGCKDCEILLATERATRAMLRENFPQIPAPDALRRRIAASLDAVDHAELRIVTPSLPDLRSKP